MSGPPGAMGPTGDWEQLYATSEVSSLPWYTTALDADIERALQEHDLRGRRILDLGTGPATQAMNLAKRGFDVLATDISPSAIKKAKASAKAAGLSIEFLVDTVFYGNVKPPPKALFATFQRGESARPTRPTQNRERKRSTRS